VTLKSEKVDLDKKTKVGKEKQQEDVLGELKALGGWRKTDLVQVERKELG